MEARWRRIRLPSYACQEKAFTEGGSGSGAGPEVFAPAAEEKVVAVNIVSPWKLSKQSDTLPAKRLRVDHPSLASGTGGKSLASLRRTILEGSLALGPSL
ncbi:hypothetical protein Tco_0842074 [Tanacetum coccineum]|uniref:Uncharacterized protein n=1 Tax=Tanacetum coccineum TaxID=301880 RepID=A0ABQ5B0Y4_9ASTR